MAAKTCVVILMAVVSLSLCAITQTPCTCPGEFKPVCGSDGQVYSNVPCMYCADPTLIVAKHGFCHPGYNVD